VGTSLLERLPEETVRLLIEEFKEQNEWARMVLKSIDDLEKLYFTVVAAVFTIIGSGLGYALSKLNGPAILVISIISIILTWLLMQIGNIFKSKAETLYRNFAEHLSVIIQIRQKLGMIDLKDGKVEGIIKFPSRWTSYWDLVLEGNVDEYVEERTRATRAPAAGRRRKLVEIIDNVNDFLQILFVILIVLALVGIALTPSSFR